MSDSPTEATQFVENSVSSLKSMQSELTAKATSAITAGLAEASAGLEKTQGQIKEQMGKAMKKAEEVASFNQGTIEAVVKSGQIWAAGVQDLSKQFAATAQTQLDETMTAFKSFSTMRSLKDVMDLQASLARSSVEKAMSETGRLTDASFKLAEQAMAPLTARVSLAVETFSKSV